MPDQMKGPLMRLLYTVKMIYNISAFYNNSVRVASLLVKITYQAIISCKSYITDNGKVWKDFVGFLKTFSRPAFHLESRLGKSSGKAATVHHAERQLQV